MCERVGIWETLELQQKDQWIGVAWSERLKGPNARHYRVPGHLYTVNVVTRANQQPETVSLLPR